MTLILMESADPINSAGYNGEKWSQVSGTVNDNITYLSRKCWTGNRNSQRAKYFPTQEHGTVIAGMRMALVYSPQTGEPIMAFQGDDGAVNHVTIESSGDGTLKVFRGATQIGASAIGVFPNGQWCSIQAKVVIDDTVGSVEVQVDKQTVINLTGVDTRNGGADALIDRFFFSSNVNLIRYRDFFIATGDGSGVSDLFVRPWTCEARVVEGAGDLADFTPNTGTNHDAVDELDPDDDTTYNESLVAGDRDCFAVQDLVTITEDPVAVSAYLIARYNSSPLSLGTFLRRSATNDDGGLSDPGAGWQSHGYTIWETDPIAAGAWTIANFNATQFGYRSA